MHTFNNLVETDMQGESARALIVPAGATNSVFERHLPGSLRDFLSPAQGGAGTT